MDFILSNRDISKKLLHFATVSIFFLCIQGENMKKYKQYVTYLLVHGNAFNYVNTYDKI